jgi:hypothetical protein
VASLICISLLSSITAMVTPSHPSDVTTTLVCLGPYDLKPEVGKRNPEIVLNGMYRAARRRSAYI